MRLASAAVSALTRAGVTDSKRFSGPHAHEARLELVNPRFSLKPGMFADVDLGTDAREALLAPADGLLHVGRSDYMLAAASSGVWRITEVRVGEVRGGRAEVLEGLKAGDRVIGRGAILLKPIVVQSLQGEARPWAEWVSTASKEAAP